MEYLQNFYQWSLQEGPFRMCEHLIVIFVIFKVLNRLRLNSRGKTGAKENLMKTIIRIGNKVPWVKRKVQKQLQTQATKNVSEMLKTKTVKGKFSELPQKGLDGDKILQMFDERVAADVNPTAGKTFAYVYECSKEHNKVTQNSFLKYMHSNALNPIVFNSLRVIENEVIRISASLFHGDEKCVGNITSCGTQSLLLAMKTYRDYRGSGTIIMCTTGHPGINKGCHYVGLDIVQIPFDENKRMSIKHLKQAISSRIVLVVCSAPQYPHGVVDDVEEIASICSSYGVPLHVDSAIGGFVLPFIEKLGKSKFGKWDFRVPGVTSINADIHKYGYSPKGSSVLIYRNSQIRRSQFFTFSTWPGGIYISPTALGTRNGGCFSSALGSLLDLGEEGFIKATKLILETVEKLVTAIQNNPELELMAVPDSTIVSFRGKNISSYKLADCMKDYGYQLQMQSNPECLHVSLMPQHRQKVDDIVECLNKSVQDILNNPDKYENDSKAVYGMLAKIPDETVVEDFMVHYMDQIYKYN